jgi:hypothetical protein
LDHPQHREDNRSPDSDRGIGRHESDKKGGDAHAEQRGNEGRLAADAVAVMAKDRRADRPLDESDKISAESGKRRRQGIFVGEIELAENKPGSGAVNEKVIPFDCRADRRCNDGFAQCDRMETALRERLTWPLTPPVNSRPP